MINKKEFIFLSLLILVGLLYQILSNGYYFIDEIAHYAYNRSFFIEPSMALDAWARFGRVILFSPVALFGKFATKFFGFLIFLLTIYFLKKIANDLKIENSEYLWLFVGFQPTYFEISFTSLPEIPTIFLTVLSLYYFMKQKFNLAVIFSSLIFLFRIESLIFSAFLFLILIYKKEYRALIFFIAGPLIIFLYSSYFASDPFFFLNEYRRYSVLPKYKSGTEALYYVSNFVNIFGIFITILFLVGMINIKRLYKNQTFILLFTASILLFLVINITSSKYFNISGNVGDLRYMTQISPFIGLISLIGFNYIIKIIRNLELKLVLVNLIIIFSLLNVFTNAKPHYLTDYEQAIIELINDAKNIDKNENIFCNHCVAELYLNYPKENFGKIQRFDNDTIHLIKKGFVIWDSLMCQSPVGFAKINSETLFKMNFRLIKHTNKANSSFYLFYKNDSTKQSNSLGRIIYFKYLSEKNRLF